MTASEAQRTENTTVHVRDKGALEYAPAGKRTSQVMMVTAPIDQAAKDRSEGIRSRQNMVTANSHEGQMTPAKNKVNTRVRTQHH